MENAETLRLGARLNVKEFASMLYYTDRYTEKRIIEGLETVDKETCEELKRNMFVFEDFVLFDAKAFALLVDEVEEEAFAMGLATCGTAIHDELLGDGSKASLRAALARSSWSPESARAAQEEAVAFDRRPDLAGRLKVLQGGQYPRSFVFTVPDDAPSGPGRRA
jgi:flagellar motor switch protein FliG